MDHEGAQHPLAPHAPDGVSRGGTWVDEIVRRAMARGEFDNLPLAGKPIPGLGARPDPDWWLKGFIEREHITGLLPEALQVRKDDAALDERLDGEHLETQVREVVAQFNARVVQARRQLRDGPPVVTATRDLDHEVARWRDRLAAGRPDQDGPTPPAAHPTQRWRRFVGHLTGRGTRS